ncbi:mitochondrial ribosomal protein-like protein subunit L7 [Microthyrium microscopicum]|uniref:Large ribosomal subunit protein uL5m n=1 Tax=Microthyrium microscopicum TaxID=703497 RepID=A0A6A6U3H3_9PEZI|nr:mitochondrial ribosomal protein-like protein subunit L7 [Microthyrium microscopicum]
MTTSYKYRPPKYYRGPLHPHQPPPPDDISSREFIPGPFTQPRLLETYDSVVASDMLALCYTHVIPGEGLKDRGDRMRHWVGDSPYYENRPPKGPKGGHGRLRPIHKPISFKNIPELRKAVIHTHVPDAVENRGYLHSASMLLQSISGHRAEVHKAKMSVQEWGAKKGKHVSLTVELEGEDMYHFMAKLVEIVMPQIKDWPGVSRGSGDSVGNISLGLRPEDLTLFPEVEVNLDMYPPDKIPGCHIQIQTSAVTDKEARLLLSTIGVPFHDKVKKR